MKAKKIRTWKVKEGPSIFSTVEANQCIITDEALQFYNSDPNGLDMRLVHAYNRGAWLECWEVEP